MAFTGLPALDTYTDLSQMGAGRAQNMAGIGGGSQGAAGGGSGGLNIGGGDTSIDLGAALNAGTSAADNADGTGQTTADKSMASNSGGGLSALSPVLIAMTKRMLASNNDDLTKEDKGLALAQAGFATAGGTSPFALTNIGQGGAEGLQALQQLRQQRALLAMKNLQLLNSGINAQALNEQRGARTDNLRQTNALTAGSIMSAGDLQPMIDEAKATGNLTPILAHLTGPAGAANKATAIRMLGDRPDLANQLLKFGAAQAQAVQTGKVAAGPDVLNPSSGQLRQQPGAIPTVAPAGAPMPGAPGGGGITMPVPQPRVAAPPSIAPPPAIKPPTPYDMMPVPQPLPMPTTPGAKSEMEGQGKALAELPAEIDGAADAAKKNSFVLNNMSAAKDHFMMGKGSEQINGANAYLLQAGQGLNATFKAAGIPQMDLSGLKDTVSNYQDFNKNSVNLVGAATKAVSPRAAVQEMNFLSQGVPGATMTDKAFDLVSTQLQSVNDLALAQQKAKQLWLSNPKNTSGTMNGFDAWFNQSIDPAVFMLHRLPPEDRAAAIDWMKNQPNGDTIVAKLAGQVKNAQQLGLFSEQ